MGLKERISSFVNQVLREYRLTQGDLANFLGISPGTLQPYVKGRSLPGIDVIIKLAELGGVTVDELLKTDKPPSQKEISMLTAKVEPEANKRSRSSSKSNVIKMNFGNNAQVGGGVVNGDVYQNTTIRKVFQYTYQPGDLTEEQAATLKRLVDEIVELEQKVKRKPGSHASVWGSLKRRFKVTYYRKIKEEDFPKAKAYLQMWLGRLSRPLGRKNEDEARKKRQTAIFAASKNQLGLTKKELDNYILDQFGVESIRDLSMKELETLYSRVMSAKPKGALSSMSQKVRNGNKDNQAVGKKISATKADLTNKIIELLVSLKCTPKSPEVKALIFQQFNVTSLSSMTKQQLLEYTGGLEELVKKMNGG